ncbi:hypothetical protein HYFRA_00011111 [Hymenoscyphus fraxineus]|uniref:Lysine-specific metallo-endopeptidase domain-containing protein n=1 Tax=Hymenoscyphus fraxineus TaxID=746836 RepID=A0A9N9L3H2_9HELO|nr:hypothetical protein HYFRA_00011111 [Hymenoscyphus fraxineus]
MAFDSVPRFRFRLSIFYLIILLIFEALAALPIRTLWFDDSCSTYFTPMLWGEVQKMLTLGNLDTNPNPSSEAGKYFKLVWGDNREDTFEFVKEAINAVNLDAAKRKEYANTYVYCDNDGRWWPPGRTPGVPYDVWYDRENHIKYKAVNRQRLKPGCIDNVRDSAGLYVAGQTYCDVTALGKPDLCTISLCSVLLTAQALAVSQLDVSPLDSSPNFIDQYAVTLTETLIHEIAHTIKNAWTGSTWFDMGPNAYRWQAVKSKKDEEAMANADNFAYWGLGCLLMSRGVAIKEDGGFRPLRRE